ncbi:MAG: universal stress protein [Syntrophobacteria bacterium]
MKILAYTDGRSAATAALRAGADLGERLGADVAILTARGRSHATEESPPVGVEIPRAPRSELQPGIQILDQAMEQLVEIGFLASQERLKIRAVRSGYLFLGSTPAGQRVPFYERYGRLIEVLNYEIDEHHHDLMVIAAPRRSRLGRFVSGDRARRLVLDLHGSLFLMRGGTMDSRLLVCADGSPSSRRLFPLLRHLLPAAGGRIDIIWVRTPGATQEELSVGRDCVQRARAWLDRCGKSGDLLMPEGDRPADLILEAAGNDCVVVMGGSLRHDVHRRVRGSLPLQVLARTESSILLAKVLPEEDVEFFGGFDTC